MNTDFKLFGDVLDAMLNEEETELKEKYLFEICSDISLSKEKLGKAFDDKKCRSQLKELLSLLRSADPPESKVKNIRKIIDNYAEIIYLILNRHI